MNPKVPFAEYASTTRGETEIHFTDGSKAASSALSAAEIAEYRAFLQDPPDEVVVARGFKRNWRSEPVKDRHEQVHSPYQGLLHEEGTDKEVAYTNALRNALSCIPEGEVVEVVIRRTRIQDPLADDPWVLQRPHKYGPNSQVEDPDWKRRR